jgi:FO synthase
MGMMLETTSRRLFETKGLAHYGSPDKDPAVRLRTLTDAGRLSIPFTTGLLVGIGETLAERAETMHAIRKSHKEFGHVQEVIVQNFRAKEHTAMAAVPDAGIDDFLATVAVRGWYSGPAMRIQAPPNLVSREECLALIGPGVDDWGGVSPLTPDHVNPERPWPALDELAAVTAEAGYDLVQRLTAQPRYVQAGSGVDRPAGAGSRDGAGRPGHRPGPRREPGGMPVAGARRGDRVAPVGPTCTRRSTPRAATPRPAAIWTVPSATGSRSAHRCTSWRR